MPLFADRADAGRQLAGQLLQYGGSRSAIVVALPRGGVPVAAEVARALSLPLEVLPVRKLGVPGHTELAFGAIASGGTVFLNRDIVGACGIAESEIQCAVEREIREMARREPLYRAGAPRIPLTGRDVLLVDDGLATGATMRAAVLALRHERPSRIAVAVPVGAADACEILSREADDLVCPARPDPFKSVGVWYEQFGQVSDGKVIECLREARDRPVSYNL
jgi:putative phosphoribosyl transferase